MKDKALDGEHHSDEDSNPELDSNTLSSENKVDGFDDAYNDKYIDINYYNKNTAGT